MIKEISPPLASTALALLACVSLAAAADNGKAVKTDPKANAAPAEKGAAADKPGTQKQVEQKATDTAQGLGAIGSILPLGQKNLDAKIPSFRDGKPSSFIHAGSMTRVDEENMYMEKMDIRLYGATQADDLRVQLITGEYNMTSQVLDSHERSRVSRNDFQLEGDSMVFDTRTQQGKMVGHVHMIIFDADALKRKPVAPPPPGSTGDAGSSSATGKTLAPAGANPANQVHK